MMGGGVGVGWGEDAEAVQEGFPKCFKWSPSPVPSFSLLGIPSAREHHVLSKSWGREIWLTWYDHLFNLLFPKHLVTEQS